MRGLIALCVGLVLVLGAGAARATTSQGDNSCNGTDACDGNMGDIGDRSCDGDFSCKNQSGEIGDDSCDGTSSCQSQSGEIGDDSCLGNDACISNTGDIGDRSCNGRESCVAQGGNIASGLCNFPSGCRGSDRDRSPCLGGGMSVSGIPGCWFIGRKGEGCNEVCQESGLSYDEATSTVADSSNEACRGVVGEGTLFFERACDGGLGCFLDTGTAISAVRCTSPPTTADASGPNAQRACACGNTQPAPTASPYGIAALLLALGGFGAWRLSKRAAA